MSQYTVLGMLVDRAVSMPFAKPQRLEGGRRVWNDKASVSEDVQAAAAFLVEALKDPQRGLEWSRARLAVDAAGPWWAKTVDQFGGSARSDDYGADVDDDGRKWILERLVPTAVTAAVAVEEEARAREWSWLWSQPSFVRAGVGGPVLTRPDLVGGNRERCVVIDVKTTGRSLNGVEYSEDAFRVWRRNLYTMGFEVDRCLVLAVSSKRDSAKWQEITP